MATADPRDEAAAACAEPLLPQLQRLLRRTTPRLTEDVPPASDFRTELHFDSLDLVELVSRIEVEFAVQIPDEDLQQFLTLEAIARYLERRLHGGDAVAVRSPAASEAHSPGVHQQSAAQAARVTGHRGQRARARVVITGMGVMSPLGSSIDELWARLLDADPPEGPREPAGCTGADW